jgi:hypothetical protein
MLASALLPAFYDLELAAASDMHLVLFRPLHLRLVEHDLCYLEESLIEVSRRFFPARFFMICDGPGLFPTYTQFVVFTIEPCEMPLAS